MNQENQAGNSERAKLPSGINVLTILTFIGCGLAGLVTLCLPLINDFVLKYLDKAASSGKDFSAREIAQFEQSRAQIELTQQHMIPLMTIGLIGVALSLVGAIWMRKLKKDGFWLYVVGELAPVIGAAIILGFDQYKSVGNIIGVLVPITFVILYSFQRKYLTK